MAFSAQGAMISLCALVVTAGCGVEGGAYGDWGRAVCGNRRVEPPEQCDDGNRRSGDGCTEACILEGEIVVKPRINDCPEITLFVVTPLRTSVGGSIKVTVEAQDDNGDVLSLLWHADAGTFADPQAPKTIYTCPSAGAQTLWIDVSDGHGCSQSSSAEVSCVRP